MTIDERLSNQIEDEQAARDAAWADEQEAFENLPESLQSAERGRNVRIK